MTTKKSVVKKRVFKKTYSQKTVNAIVRHVAAKAIENTVGVNTNIAKEWVLWEIASQIAQIFSASYQVKRILNHPARDYASARDIVSVSDNT